MAKVRTNVLFNYAGQLWIAVAAIVFVPVYIKALGIEAFGLVGLMLSLQAISIVLDLGMSGILTRELARRRIDATAAQTMRTLVTTLERVVWPAALLIGVAIVTCSSWLAIHWLHPVTLTVTATSRAIALIGIVIALQWPASFYNSGLYGLERQPTANVINIVFATLRSAGAAFALCFVSPTIETFMGWQAIVGGMQTLVTALVMRHALPNGPSRFDMHELVNARRFAGGLAIITALSVALMQLDRIVLSTLRPLTDVGYLTLALSIAGGLGRLVQPVFNALYPRFNVLVAAGQHEELTKLYHFGNQLVGAVAGAAAAVLIVYSEQVLYLWTGDAVLAPIVAAPMAILVAGSTLNGFYNLPYAMQLSHEWTRLAVVLNAACLIIGVPVSIILISLQGLVGAAWLWLLINAVFIAIGVPWMHKRLLQGELGTWYTLDMLPPVASAFAVATCLHWLVPGIPRDSGGVVKLALISAGTLVAALAATSAGRVGASAALHRRHQT